MFQSTPLMRGATRRRGRAPSRSRFNPRPSCEGRLHVRVVALHAGPVSIHAPHARGDRVPQTSTTSCRSFNPRPSCEGRLTPSASPTRASPFQSTPLMRGATTRDKEPSWLKPVSIHAPHARGDLDLDAPRNLADVSIHAPHARGDSAPYGLALPLKSFQSTPLMRGATAGAG